MKIAKCIFQKRKIRTSTEDTFDADYKGLHFYITSDHGFGEADEPDLKRFNIDVTTIERGYSAVESWEDFETIEKAIEYALEGAMCLPFQLAKRNNTGIFLIEAERREQIEKHGRTIEKDIVENYNRELSQGAEMLLASEHEEGIDSASYPEGWDHEICMNMLNKPYKEKLIIAGALIVAELDRINTLDYPSFKQRYESLG